MPFRSRVTLFVVLVLLFGMIVWLSFFSASVSNVSALKTGSNLGVYWNPNCSDVVSSIDWERLTPGSNKSVVVYVRNEMNESVTLSFETQNWSPSNASAYLYLSWNYNGSWMYSDEVRRIVLSLFVSPDIQGITFFSFDIIVASTPTPAREWPITYGFEDSLSAKEDSSRHQFEVPSGTSKIEVWLEMPSGADFDVSLWDDLDRRTGGWISTDHNKRMAIPNSQYSGYLAEPEWIIVEPPVTTGTWKVGGFAFSGSGTYKITVTLHGPLLPDFGISADPDSLTFGKPLSGSTSHASTITVASLNDFGSTVMLSGSWVGTVPTGVGYYFDPESITPPPNSYETSTLTVTVDSTASTGTFTLRITGTNNSISRHIDVTITMTPANQEYVFEGAVSTGQDSPLHIFAVPAGTSRVEVWLEMPSGVDIDLSLWDNLDRRTGGWISTDHNKRMAIPNSQYSGYLAEPEWIIVEPPATSGTWNVGCFLTTRGSGTYKITVTIMFGA